MCAQVSFFSLMQRVKDGSGELCVLAATRFIRISRTWRPAHGRGLRGHRCGDTCLVMSYPGVRPPDFQGQSPEMTGDAPTSSITTRETGGLPLSQPILTSTRPEHLSETVHPCDPAFPRPPYHLPDTLIIFDAALHLEERRPHATVHPDSERKRLLCLSHSHATGVVMHLISSDFV